MACIARAFNLYYNIMLKRLSWQGSNVSFFELIPVIDSMLRILIKQGRNQGRN